MTDKNIKPIFVVGKIVTLNSGGPDMTIKGFHTINGGSSLSEDKFNGSYVCQCFAGKKLEQGVFPQSSLKLVDKKELDNEWC